MQTIAQPTALATAPVAPAAVGVKKERDVAHGINQEYHNPFDAWSNRDTLLSLVPFIVTYAFKDAALNAALAFAIAFQTYLLIKRLTSWGGWHNKIWPDLDITGIIAFSVLRGLNRHYAYYIHKWWNVILPLIFISMALISLMLRRAFTAHYARYPYFDRGGRGLWERDAAFRRTADITTLIWITVWSIQMLLSLIPILTGHFLNFGVLNIIFNYVTPFTFQAIALLLEQLVGRMYFRRAVKASETTIPAATYVSNYPAGAQPTAAVPTTYSTAA